MIRTQKHISRYHVKFMQLTLTINKFIYAEREINFLGSWI